MDLRERRTQGRQMLSTHAPFKLEWQQQWLPNIRCVRGFSCRAGSVGWQGDRSWRRAMNARPCHVTQFKFEKKKKEKTKEVKTISVLPFTFFVRHQHARTHTWASACSNRTMRFPKSFACYSLFVSFLLFVLSGMSGGCRRCFGFLFSFLCRLNKKK